MGSNFINPKYKPHRELSLTDDEWAALKTKVTDFMVTNAALPTLSIADARNLDTKLRNDRVWAQLSSDLGLFEIS